MKSVAHLNRLYTIFFTVFLSSVSAQQKEGWLTWNNTANTITISYPKDWTETKLNAGEIVAFIAPKTDAKDSYPDMMVLRAFPDSGIKDIGRLKNFAQSTLSPKWNFKITSSQKIKSSDKEYIKSVAEDSKRKIVLVMYTLLKEGHIFFFTLNVEKRNYERYAASGQHTFESLTIGPLPTGE